MQRLAATITIAVVIASLTPQVLAGSEYWQGRMGSLYEGKGKGYSTSSSMYNWGKGYVEQGKGKGKGASSSRGYVFGTSRSSSSRSRYVLQFSSRSSVPRSSRSAYPSGNCRWKGDSIIEASFPGQIDYQGGWTFPGLIAGDCPVYTGILRVKESPTSPFGPLNW